LQVSRVLQVLQGLQPREQVRVAPVQLSVLPPERAVLWVQEPPVLWALPEPAASKLPAELESEPERRV
jgi:hypothetical protein